MDSSVDLRVGDRVIVLDPVPDHKYGVARGMRRFEGKEVTISAVLDKDCYELKEDTDGWTWGAGMFAGYAEPDGTIGSCLRTGNIVVLKDGKDMLCTGTSLRSPKGFSLSLDHYRGEDRKFTNIHDSNEKFEIVEVYSPANDSNYMFDKGDLIWKSEE